MPMRYINIGFSNEVFRVQRLISFLKINISSLLRVRIRWGFTFQSSTRPDKDSILSSKHEPREMEYNYHHYKRCLISF